MKIIEALNEGVKILDENQIENSKMNARRLLAFVLDKDKEYVSIYQDNEIDDNLYKLYLEKINRLKKHEPIQYILNNQEFMGMDFYVDSNVLIPQPDTENLVEEVILISDKIREEDKKKELRILDLCTGSGAIAVSLVKLLNNVLVYASDISENALKIAEENANSNSANVFFFKSDIFENISKLYKFDIIVSNPPYIETKTIESLSEEVKNEPHIALDGGEDGLVFYREIIKNAKEYLNPNGYLALEIGYNQKEKVEKLLDENGYKNIYSKKDLSGNDRVVVAQM